jgi:hypothetical protein
MPRSRLAHLRVSGQQAPALHALKTITNSRNILLVSCYLRTVRSRHREPAAGAGQLPRVTGREQAMVLTGLIIIAVALMALMVPGMPGIQWKLSAPMPAAGPDRAAPGYRGVTSRAPSPPAMPGPPATRPGTGSPRRPPGNTIRLTHPDLAHAGNASRQYGHGGSSSTTPASGATPGKPPDCRTRMRADRPDLHAPRAHSP